jgi:hypothetical protein
LWCTASGGQIAHLPAHSTHSGSEQLLQRRMWALQNDLLQEEHDPKQVEHDVLAHCAQ